MRPGREEVDDKRAEQLLRLGITRLVRHPACIDYHFRDGRVLAHYPGGNDHPDTWILEKPDAEG